jgi:ADP-ribose pyrophosphatase YjhB (NUDIX family)
MTFKRPSVTADIIVEKDNQILLVKRKHNPFKGKWALPGGFLDVGKETVKQTAQRELKEETGLVVKLCDLELVGESSNPHRDPRGHIVSIHYYAKKYTGTPKASDDAAELAYFPINNLPELAFDHAQILNDYFKARELRRIK